MTLVACPLCDGATPYDAADDDFACDACDVRVEVADAPAASVPLAA